jgi:hypothetical protein
VQSFGPVLRVRWSIAVPVELPHPLARQTDQNTRSGTGRCRVVVNHTGTLAPFHAAPSRPWCHVAGMCVVLVYRMPAGAAAKTGSAASSSNCRSCGSGERDRLPTHVGASAHAANGQRRSGGERDNQCSKATAHLILVRHHGMDERLALRASVGRTVPGSLSAGGETTPLSSQSPVAIAAGRNLSQCAGLPRSERVCR